MTKNFASEKASTSSDEKATRHIQFQSPLKNDCHEFDIKANDDHDFHDDLNAVGLDDDINDGRRLRHRRRRQQQIDAWIPLAQMSAVGIVLVLSMLVIFAGQFYGGQRSARQRNLARSSTMKTPNTLATSKLKVPSSAAAVDDTALCSKTCRMRLVESIPQNLTFATPPKSMYTFDAWMNLINSAKHTLAIAAYKSSLRGRHVFGRAKQQFSAEGEKIYAALAQAGLQRKVNIRILENSPSKDKGDNEDARDLEEMGAIIRRQLNLQRLNGAGVMHSKFIIADSKNFYLGSANLDWRSLNQKMEMGLYVSDCACLARDVNALFELYWRLALAGNSIDASAILKDQSMVRFGSTSPFRTKIQSQSADVFLAASPQFMNAPRRVWDLEAIVNVIYGARTYLLIHVMDYFPVFIYSKEKRFWPTIDQAIRSAVLRGVHVKILTAALHYPNISMRFLQSLEALNALPGEGSIEIKVLKVPSSPDLQSVIKRDRRTHKKFLLSDDHAVIGTSNWSGDYFEGGTTGVAIVVHQNASDIAPASQTLLEEMRNSFERDWHSMYAHSLRKYVDYCVELRLNPVQTASCANSTWNMCDKSVASLPDFCEPEKDKKLFVKPAMAMN